MYDFQFIPPRVEPGASKGASAAIRLSALASRLAGVKRTRCNHPDGRAENDAEHSYMLSKVAPELADMLYPELDTNLVARFATVHDDVEAYVGDTPTDILSKLDATVKARREAAGTKRLLQDFAALPAYCALVKQYEDQMLPEARFVRAADKLMVLCIHLPNEAAVLRTHYTYESFLTAERTLMQRDGYKYGEFELIADLRRELAELIAERYLRHQT